MTLLTHKPQLVKKGFDEPTLKLYQESEVMNIQHIVSAFTSPDHLASQVVTDLHNLLRDTSTEGEAEPSKGGSKYQINITHGQGIVIGDGNQVTQHYSNTSVQPQRDRFDA